MCIEIGTIEKLSLWIMQNADNVYILSALWGIVSIVLDSVIIIINNANLCSVESWQIISRSASFGQNGAFWPLLNYFCLFGSTLLTIGTVGGIMLMRMENVSLAWYIRRITPKVAIGGIAGTITILIITTLLV